MKQRLEVMLMYLYWSDANVAYYL